MSKTCPPRKLRSGTDLRHGLEVECCQILAQCMAFPAPPSLVPDRELEVTSKDSFVVSNEIACLNLMDVWKEPLICVGWQKFHTPDKQQGDIFTFKKKLLGSLDQLPKVKSRCHH